MVELPIRANGLVSRRRGRRRFHDAADDNAIGEHVEVIIAPLAGWAARRRTLEDQLLDHVRDALRLTLRLNARGVEPWGGRPSRPGRKLMTSATESVMVRRRDWKKAGNHVPRIFD